MRRIFALSSILGAFVLSLPATTFAIGRQDEAQGLWSLKRANAAENNRSEGISLGNSRHKDPQASPLKAETQQRDFVIEAQRAANNGWNNLMGYSNGPDPNDPTPARKKVLNQTKQRKIEVVKADLEADRLTQFYGLCSEVISSDTFAIQRGLRVETVHLFGVQAPDRSQARGEEILALMKKRLEGQYVVVDPSSLAPDGSIIGGISLNDRPIAPQMLKNGLARCTSELRARKETFSFYELEARIAHVGIWADSSSIDLKEWRKPQMGQ